nr:MAG TPA: hypothetical protein [Caudoviricetes sp.]
MKKYIKPLCKTHNMCIESNLCIFSATKEGEVWNNGNVTGGDCETPTIDDLDHNDEPTCTH